MMKASPEELGIPAGPAEGSGGGGGVGGVSEGDQANIQHSFCLLKDKLTTVMVFTCMYIY